MDIIQVLVVLVVVGVILWLVQTYIPMAPPIKTILTIVVVLFLCIWLLGVFGIGHYTISPR
jgi:hypothetical protein